MLTILITITFISCNNSTNNKKEIIKLNIESKENIKEIEQGFYNLNTQNFLYDKLLIGEIGKLNGLKSISIKGYKSYELNGKGKIISTYNITNNYEKYFYNKENQLIKVEYKQHNPPEIYKRFEYKYSNENILIKIIETSFKRNKKLKSEIISDKIKLDKMKEYFVGKKGTEYQINNEKQEIITFENKMVFCCGEIMDGKNKLTYHLNENGLIDSLIINGIETKKKMKFVYEYE